MSAKLINEAIQDDLAYKLAMQTSSEKDVCKHCGSSTAMPFIRLIGFHKILDEMRKGDANKHGYVGLTLQRKDDNVVITNKKTKQQKTYSLWKKQEV